MSEAHSIPLIRLFDNLIVSIQVELSDDIVERLMSQITAAIERTNVSGLILDFSGAEIMDSHITRRVHDIAMTARLMGVDTVVCGLKASIVITLTEMGLGLPGVASALNLERALELLVSKNLLAKRAPPRVLAGDGERAAAPNPTREIEGHRGPRR
ncbi:MAG: STAS domain-containing protein [Minicystis sp.]